MHSPPYCRGKGSWPNIFWYICPPFVVLSAIWWIPINKKLTMGIYKSLKSPNGNQNRRRTDNTMAKRKRTNNDLQNIAQKTKDLVTRTPLKTLTQYHRRLVLLQYTVLWLFSFFLIMEVNFRDVFKLWTRMKFADIYRINFRTEFDNHRIWTTQ